MYKLFMKSALLELSPRTMTLGILGADLMKWMETSGKDKSERGTFRALIVDVCDCAKYDVFTLLISHEIGAQRKQVVFNQPLDRTSKLIQDL